MRACPGAAMPAVYIANPLIVPAGPPLLLQTKIYSTLRLLARFISFVFIVFSCRAHISAGQKARILAQSSHGADLGWACLSTQGLNTQNGVNRKNSRVVYVLHVVLYVGLCGGASGGAQPTPRSVKPRTQPRTLRRVGFLPHQMLPEDFAAALAIKIARIPNATHPLAKPADAPGFH